MLGDAGVGKTSLVKRFVNNDFQKYYIETVGIDYMERLVEIPANAAYEATIDNVTYEDTSGGDVEIGVDLVQLQIWDTAGQDRFREEKIQPEKNLFCLNFGGDSLSLFVHLFV